MDCLARAARCGRVLLLLLVMLLLLLLLQPPGTRSQVIDLTMLSFQDETESALPSSINVNKHLSTALLDGSYSEIEISASVHTQGETTLTMMANSRVGSSKEIPTLLQQVPVFTPISQSDHVVSSTDTKAQELFSSEKLVDLTDLPASSRLFSEIIESSSQIQPTKSVTSSVDSSKVLIDIMTSSNTEIDILTTPLSQDTLLSSFPGTNKNPLATISENFNSNLVSITSDSLFISSSSLIHSKSFSDANISSTSTVLAHTHTVLATTVIQSIPPKSVSLLSESDIISPSKTTEEISDTIQESDEKNLKLSSDQIKTISPTSVLSLSTVSRFKDQSSQNYIDLFSTAILSDRYSLQTSTIIDETTKSKINISNNSENILIQSTETEYIDKTSSAMKSLSKQIQELPSLQSSIPNFKSITVDITENISGISQTQTQNMINSLMPSQTLSIKINSNDFITQGFPQSTPTLSIPNTKLIIQSDNSVPKDVITNSFDILSSDLQQTVSSSKTSVLETRDIESSIAHQTSSHLPDVYQTSSLQSSHFSSSTPTDEFSITTSSIVDESGIYATEKQIESLVSSSLDLLSSELSVSGSSAQKSVSYLSVSIPFSTAASTKISFSESRSSFIDLSHSQTDDFMSTRELEFSNIITSKEMPLSSDLSIKDLIISSAQDNSLTSYPFSSHEKIISSQISSEPTLNTYEKSLLTSPYPTSLISGSEFLSIYPSYLSSYEELSITKSLLDDSSKVYDSEDKSTTPFLKNSQVTSTFTLTSQTSQLISSEFIEGISLNSKPSFVSSYFILTTMSGISKIPLKTVDLFYTKSLKSPNVASFSFTPSSFRKDFFTSTHTAEDLFTDKFVSEASTVSLISSNNLFGSISESYFSNLASQSTQFFSGVSQQTDLLDSVTKSIFSLYSSSQNDLRLTPSFTLYSSISSSIPLSNELIQQFSSTVNSEYSDKLMPDKTNLHSFSTVFTSTKIVNGPIQSSFRESDLSVHMSVLKSSNILEHSNFISSTGDQIEISPTLVSSKETQVPSYLQTTLYPESSSLVSEFIDVPESTDMLYSLTLISPDSNNMFQTFQSSFDTDSIINSFETMRSSLLIMSLTPTPQYTLTFLDSSINSPKNSEAVTNISMIESINQTSRDMNEVTSFPVSLSSDLSLSLYDHDLSMESFSDLTTIKDSGISDSVSELTNNNSLLGSATFSSSMSLQQTTDFVYTESINAPDKTALPDTTKAIYSSTIIDGSSLEFYSISNTFISSEVFDQTNDGTKLASSFDESLQSFIISVSDSRLSPSKMSLVIDTSSLKASSQISDISSDFSSNSQYSSQYSFILSTQQSYVTISNTLSPTNEIYSDITDTFLSIFSSTSSQQEIVPSSVLSFNDLSSIDMLYSSLELSSLSSFQGFLSSVENTASSIAQSELSLSPIFTPLSVNTNQSFTTRTDQSTFSLLNSVSTTQTQGSYVSFMSSYSLSTPISSSFNNLTFSLRESSLSFVDLSSSFINPSSYLITPSSFVINPSSLINSSSFLIDSSFSIINPSSPFIDLSSSFTNSSSPFIDLSSSFTNPSSPLIDLSSSFNNPSTPFIDLSSSFTNPSSSFINPSSFFIDPSFSFINPSSSVIDPSSSVIDSSSSLIDPLSSFIDSSFTFMASSSSSMDLSSSFINPFFSLIDSSSFFIDPLSSSIVSSSSFMGLTSSFINPSSAFSNPSSSFTNSLSSFMDLSSYFINPSFSLIYSSSYFINPSSSFLDPSSAFINSSSSYINPLSSFVDSSFHSLDLSSSFINPTPSFINPSSSLINPLSSFMDLSSFFINPSFTFIDSSSYFINSSSLFVNPSSSFINLSSSFINPSSSFINPSSTSINASISSINPSSSFINPSSTSINTSISSINPSSSFINPSSTSINTSISSINPSSSLPIHPLTSIVTPIPVTAYTTTTTEKLVSTVPTIENNVNNTDYWIKTVLMIRPSVNIQSQAFKSAIEQRLADVYETIRQRKERIANGTFVPFDPLTRRKRETSAQGNDNIQVEVVEVSREGTTTNVDINHVVQADGELVEPSDAVQDLGLLNDMEMAIMLGYPVAEKGTPYKEKSDTSSSDDIPWYIIGPVIGIIAVLLALLIICYCCCCKKKQEKAHISDIVRHPEIMEEGGVTSVARVEHDNEKSGLNLPFGSSRRGNYTVNPENESHISLFDKKKTSAHTQENGVGDQPVQKPSPKKRKARKACDSDEEMRSVYESQIASLDAEPLNDEKMTFTLSQQPTVEDEGDLLVNAEEERRKNKHRLREKRLKEKEHSSPVKSHDRLGQAYENAQKEIDRVLAPKSKKSEGDRKERSKHKSKEKKKKKKGEDNAGYSTDERKESSDESKEEEKGENPESLDEARNRMHKLLDDAFSLISHSRSSVGNKVAPVQDNNGEGSSSEQSVSSNKSEKPDHKFQNENPAYLQSSDEKKHTPIDVLRSHEAYDRSGLITWSPYTASDDMALISLPQEQTTLSSGPPPEDKLTTSTFTESLPASLRADVYTTEPAKPIVIRSKDLTTDLKSASVPNVSSVTIPNPVFDNSGYQPSQHTHLYSNLSDSVSPYNALPKFSDISHNQGEELHAPKPKMDAWMNETEPMSHIPPQRGDAYDYDEVDVISRSLQPGASPQPLVNSLRQELKSLSDRRMVNSQTQNPVIDVRNSDDTDRRSQPPSINVNSTGWETLDNIKRTEL